MWMYETSSDHATRFGRIYPWAPLKYFQNAFTKNGQCVHNMITSILPIGSMYGIYANIWGILMVHVTIYTIHTDPMGYNKSLCN